MDLSATAQVLGNLGEFLGSIVVLITLLYLAVQVRQTRLSVQSSSWQDGVNSIIEWNFRIAEAPELVDIFQRGMADPDALSSQEQLRLALMISSFLQQFHKWYLDNQKGLVEEKAWLGESQSMVAILSTPGGARYWEKFEVPFTPGFRAYVDERLREARTGAHFRYNFDNVLA